MQRRSFFKWAATVFLPAPVVAPVAAPVVADVITRETLIAAHLRMSAGKRLLAASMMQPLRIGRDYKAFGDYALFGKAAKLF